MPMNPKWRPGMKKAAPVAAVPAKITSLPPGGSDEGGWQMSIKLAYSTLACPGLVAARR